jgi:hypothetical protein
MMLSAQDIVWSPRESAGRSAGAMAVLYGELEDR